MTSSRLLLPCVLALGVAPDAACGLAGDDAAAATAPARSTATATDPAVLVELFTSQGCSSCPPADRLLGELPAAVDGVQVLPLAFHVDYWDDLGWRDPFSSAEWTARQNRYAQSLGAGRIYTPQLVVQGGRDVVGSDRGGAVALIERAAHAPAERGRISATATTGGDRVAVSVEAALPSRGSARADVWVALVESGLATQIARGENQGRALMNHFVVRRLVKGMSLDAAGSRRGDVSLALEPGWRRDRMGVTVFLQDPSSLAILAAGSASFRPARSSSSPD
jgi:hypothetical protein